MTSARTHDDYSVGWVCALSKEQTAATAMLDQRHDDLPKPPSDNNAYTLGSIGKHNIVIACLPEGGIGTNSATNVVTQMVNTFPSIKFGLMVGIGGGIPLKVRLGDVVLSKPVGEFSGVVQWDLGKAEKGGNFVRTGSLNRPPKALLMALAKLKTKHEMSGPKIPGYLDDLKTNWPRLAPKYTWSDSFKDPLFESDNSQSNRSLLSKLWEAILAFLGVLLVWRAFATTQRNAVVSSAVAEGQRKPGDMHIHYGLIASGNQVIKDSAVRDEVNKSLGGHVLCVEMEAAGLMNNFPCIVVRGICDYAESHKNKDWQEYAAAIAAAFAKELLGSVQPSDVEGERRVKDMLLQQVHADVSTIKEDVTRIKSNVDKEKDKKVLDWITSADYGPQQSDHLRNRQSGTGQWLLESGEFQGWLTASNQTLFCPGIPGAGKTILTSIVFDKLDSMLRSDPKTGMAYIFCNFQQQHQQNLEDLLASVLKQLAASRSLLPESIKKLYNRHEAKRTRPSLDDIRTELESVVAQYSRAFIIIDALDECQTSSLTKFLPEILKLQKRHCINIFATSRLIPEIMRHFQDSNSIRLDIRATTSDVTSYLEGHISDKFPGYVQNNQELKEEIKKGISEAVDGMFLLASLYLHLLGDNMSINDIRSALKDFQNRVRDQGDGQKGEVLTQAYEQAMKRINEQTSGLRSLATDVLLWITCAKRALTTSELRHALAIKTGKSEFDDGDLPDLEVHYTTQEYLERTQERWFPEAESAILGVCITYLSFSVFEAGFCEANNEFEKRQLSYPLYNYAARNWGHHAEHVEPSQELISFLKSQSKVEASSQALMAVKQYSTDSHYSQLVPRRVTGLHLAGYFGVSKVTDTLLRLGTNPNLEDSHNRTPLLLAAQNGHEAVVNLLLGKGANINAPLSWAAGKGEETVVRLLLEKSADVNTKDRASRTPLSWAALYRRKRVIQLLLEKGANMDGNDEAGRIKLLASGVERETVIQLLFGKGAGLNDMNEDGQTPLLLAARDGQEAIARVLLEAGADIEAKDAEEGATPLIWAAEGGHEAVVQLLLDKGADIHARDRDHHTPLFAAAGLGNEDVTKKLLDKGADVNARNSSGWTPLFNAAGLGREAIVKLLLEKEADIDAKGEDGRTPLFFATALGQKAVVQLLLGMGADINAKDEDGRMPFFSAVGFGDESVLELLLQTGKIDIDAADDCGQTPLLWAAQKGHEAIIKLLLKQGANVNAVDGDGQTALSWAIEKGHIGVVQLLLETGKVEALLSS